MLIKLFVSLVYLSLFIPGNLSEEKIKKSNDYYTVLVPGKLRSNSNHLVTVSIRAPATNVSAAIIGKNADNETVKFEQFVSVPENETVIVPIAVGLINSSFDYKFFVNGSGGINFTHNVDLHYDKLHKLAFIQTDKAIYKPGQKVLFRVFIVNQELRPLDNESLKIQIKDSKENIIYSNKNRTSKNGLVIGELQLSEEPLLGDWKIDVAGDDVERQKNFKIEEYIVPNFGVNIRVPRLITKNTTSFLVTVESKYTYGKPVKGELTLKIADAYYSYFRLYASEQGRQKRVEFLSEINGVSHVEVNVADFLDANNFYDAKEYIASASVRDYLTDKVYNKTEKFKVYNDKYKFRLLDGSRQFVTGLNFTAVIKITYPNDDLVDADDEVKIIYGFGYQDGKKREQLAKPINGVVRVNLDTTPFEEEPMVITSKTNGTRKTIYLPKKDDSSAIKVEAEFRGVRYLVGYIYKSSRANNCYAELRLKNNLIEPKFKVGDDIEFKLESISTPKEFVYHLINKYGVVKSEKVVDSNTFSVHLNQDSSPKSRVVVHYDCNGTISSDGYDVTVDGLIKKSVNISSNFNETKPGKPVSLNIETKPDTTVALLGVDQRVLLLSTGNDISKEDLVSGTEKYLGCKGQSYFESCAESGTHYWLDQPTPWEIRRSGLILLSNKYNIHRPYPMPVPIAFSSTGLRGGIAARPSASRPLPGPTSTTSANQAEHTTTVSDTYDENARIESFQVSKKKASGIRLEDIKVRKEFPETWLWELVDVNSTGIGSITKNVPDAITSWAISGIGINQQDGLSLSNLAEVNVFRPFFIKVSLPYSIIRDEIVAIEVTVYNYFKVPNSAEVTLHNQLDEFEFINGSQNAQNAPSKLTQKTKKINIQPNDGVTTSFLIRAKKLGPIIIDISAINGDQTVGDRINEKLLVKPEGETHYRSVPKLIQLDTSSTVKHAIPIEIEGNIVPDSEKVSVDVVSNILGQQIDSLGDLLRVPYGCGEQNMVNFVPNIVILNYLNKTQKLTPKIKEKAVSNMETGYQRELTYRHNDGSYSAFGKADKDGSTWLTAFVTKSFEQAKPYIKVDQNIIDKGLDFLRSKQNNDGSFREDGRVLSRSMSSGNGGETGTLTAYVVVSLTAGQNVSTKDEMLAKAEQYLLRRLEKTDDNYETVILAYALHRLNSNKKDESFEKLNKIRVSDRDYYHWSQNNTKKSDESSVEMTSYALMTYLLRNETEQSLPILRWLISKQNSKGGFSSTQDTVIGIESLAKFATFVATSRPDMTIQLKTDQDKSHTLKLNEDNAIVLQKISLDKKTKQVSFDATGSGTAVVRVSWQYNKLANEGKPSFDLRHEYTETNSAVTVNVCTRYLAGNESGMTLLEVTLPSGVTADLETFDDMKKTLVKRVETKLSNTVIVVYFDKITKEETCVPFVGNKVNKIANSKPVPITVYDYYDRSKRMTSFYQPIQHTTCEICEDTDCDSSCQP